MSKLSVRPDTNRPPLQATPCPFPKLNNVLLPSNTLKEPSREVNQLKFPTSKQTLPNLFQYNDRSRLQLSSDEEE